MDNENIDFKNPKNSHFSMVLVKKHREEVFGDVLVKKQACLDNRNIDFKKRQP